jgi:GNAT superfamily N-acetyltransferase
MRIVEVDPVDEALFDAWHGVYWRSANEGLGDLAAAWTRDELWQSVMRPTGRWVFRELVMLDDDGAAVAAAHVRLPLLDNRDRALVDIHVDPPARRRGHGTALLAHVESWLRSQGRTVVLVESRWLYDAGPDGTGWPGPAFAAARGYALALGDVQRRLALPVPAGLLERLGGEAAPAAYTLRGWHGPVPEDLLAAYAELDALVETEAPTGELEVEPETPDVDTVRRLNEQLVAQRRTRYGVVALDAAGAAVGYTEIVVPDAEPGRAYQWGTLVRREHRGHRLGLALKVVNLVQLQELRPDVTHVLTYNAEVNTHMVGVNEALGFEPVGRLGEFQKRLS